ncbi:MAG: nucleoside recognition domain-containing protein, partial [Candidatus Bathyarchaeia archaeon]
ALWLYALNIVLIFALGRMAFKVLPGEPIGLIMEVPPYKKPSLRAILLKTWFRTKEFVYIAFPIIVAGSLTITTMDVTGLMENVTSSMKPFMQGWLGLPAEAGIPLIFGVLRKELTLILLSGLIPLESLTAVQMIVFALITMIYIPCIATIAALIKEFGWRKALAVTLVDIVLALLIGGLAYRVLALLL